MLCISVSLVFRSSIRVKIFHFMIVCCLLCYPFRIRWCQFSMTYASISPLSLKPCHASALYVLWDYPNICNWACHAFAVKLDFYSLDSLTLVTKQSGFHTGDNYMLVSYRCFLVGVLTAVLFAVWISAERSVLWFLVFRIVAYLS